MLDCTKSNNDALQIKIKHHDTTLRFVLSHRNCINDASNHNAVTQVDTGKELKRVSWQMMRNIVHSTIHEIETLLNEMCLPGQVHICAEHVLTYHTHYLSGSGFGSDPRF